MANQSGKKILANNQKILKYLNIVLPSIHIYYILVRFIFQWKSWTIGTIFAYLLTGGLSTWIVYQFNLYGNPECDRNGVPKGGQFIDLSDPGVISYTFDILYIIWFTLVLSTFTSYAWYLLLSVPAYAFYKAYTMKDKLPLGGQRQVPFDDAPAGAQQQQQQRVRGGNAAEPQPDSKRQQKLKKRQEKGHYKYAKA
ncbi:DUF788-domain-containing protein [Conidiobolus coronatus NRRL 28638]|uniref:DUF788-domain-containing protein n=1 Tax=Conidiobolus coronatus (strain ATCC 28846 / CBS 209.66 / NRRL 28638) TaxID=796925 RepID=A0A137P2H2_CONC2|nr:DUF788-domain-containing protein [Conidiobolus coronatus NRRL 28638]|eukprot:KXN69099.1 DUF788-domain-containing protein [Conidiobolus coronatus NRRL 28638]